MNKRMITKAAMELPEDIISVCPEFAADGGVTRTAGKVERRAVRGSRNLFKGIVLPVVLLAAGLTAAVVTAAVLKNGKNRQAGQSELPAEEKPDTIAAAATEPPRQDVPRDVSYVPDYYTDNTLHVNEFIELLRRDGYHRGDTIDRNFNTDNIEKCRNVTPPGMAKEIPDLEMFYVSGSGAFFLKYRNELYRFDTFGGQYLKMCYWDHDGNGTPDLVAQYTAGSGIPYMGLTVIDLTTMTPKGVISRMLLEEEPFEFAFDGENAYVDQKLLTYSDGKFLLDGEEMPLFWFSKKR